jgi:hypothetical protein
MYGKVPSITNKGVVIHDTPSTMHEGKQCMKEDILSIII